jgi:hypothetical protein
VYSVGAREINKKRTFSIHFSQIGTFGPWEARKPALGYVVSVHAFTGIGRGKQLPVRQLTGQLFRARSIRFQL